MPETEDRPDGRWMHSFEEDHEGVEVYRPSGHPFPPARGRAGIEFHPDGTFVDLPVGRGDANEARPGRWHQGGPGPIQVRSGGRAMEVVRTEPDRLEVRRSEPVEGDIGEGDPVPDKASQKRTSR